MEIKEIREFIRELNTAAVILVNNRYDTTADRLTKVADRLAKAANILEQLTKEQEPLPPGHELTAEDVPRLNLGKTKIEISFFENFDKPQVGIYIGFDTEEPNGYLWSIRMNSFDTLKGSFARIPLPEKPPQWKKGDPIVVWNNDGIKHNRHFIASLDESIKTCETSPWTGKPNYIGIWPYGEPATEQALREGGFSEEQIAELKERNCVKGG